MVRVCFALCDLLSKLASLSQPMNNASTARTRFHALGTGCMYLILVLIG